MSRHKEGLQRKQYQDKAVIELAIVSRPFSKMPTCRTYLISATLTVVTSATRSARFHRHAIADFQVFHLGPDLMTVHGKIQTESQYIVWWLTDPLQ